MNPFRLIVLLSALTVISNASAANANRTMQYHPDGRDIVSVDGQNRYTRALYGGYTDFRVETSDRPIFGTYRGKSHRNIRFRLTVGGKTLALEQTAHCEARYNAGLRTYRLADPLIGRGTLTISVLAMPDSEAAIWRIVSGGIPAGATMECVVCGIKHPKFHRYGDMNADPADSFDPAPDENNRQTVTWEANSDAYIYLDCDNKGQYTLSQPADGERLWQKAMKHHEWLAEQIVFDTPDPYINALGGALTAAADGAWDGKVWLHGAVVWRMPLNGWRAGFLGDVMGWPERALSHFSAYAASQVTDVEPVIPHPSQDPEKGLARAVKTWGTQMYSNGYIVRTPNRTDIMHHYDMNLNYIDELLWHFQYDADTVFMRKMWPVLKRHLEWEKRNYDPDDDGLYDAYCCIWASDALYYNSGAVTHSTAYNYRGFSLAAKIAEMLGEDPAYYRKEAEKTLSALNKRLWLKDRGHWAEYQDFMGLKRTHDHAALWSIYTPIDCGAATEEQAFRATQYVDSCIPHIPVVWEKVKGQRSKSPQLSTISTTDWMPYDWSINNVAAEEVMHTALAYFQAGRSEEAYRLMKANIMDLAYLGGSPGNFGQISCYDKARGELYRDFSDNTGISARTFMQGLFGIVPDALSGRCILRPGFPADWKHASISTPYFKYSFRRDGNKEVYEIEQNFAQPLQVVLRQNTGYGYVETLGTTERKQTIVVRRPKRQTAPQPLVTAWKTDDKAWGNNFDDVKTDRMQTVDIGSHFNSSVSDIFKNFYLSPRSPYTTLSIPVHGIGEWCHPDMKATIDDQALRQQATDGELTVNICGGIPFRYPQKGKNIVYTSLWDNYPESVTIPLKGSATHAYLLMAGSTNHMQSGIDNGLVIARYADGSADTLRLHNPHNWCPIEQDYYEDGLAFHAAQPRPYRIDFATGQTSRELMPMGEHYGQPAATGVASSYHNRNFEKGAGIILDMPLKGEKPLESLTLCTLSNDVVIGLMGLTLQIE